MGLSSGNQTWLLEESPIWFNRKFPRRCPFSSGISPAGHVWFQEPRPLRWLNGRWREMRILPQSSAQLHLAGAGKRALGRLIKWWWSSSALRKPNQKQNAASKDATKGTQTRVSKVSLEREKRLVLKLSQRVGLGAPSGGGKQTNSDPKGLFLQEKIGKTRVLGEGWNVSFWLPKQSKTRFRLGKDLFLEGKTHLCRKGWRTKTRVSSLRNKGVKAEGMSSTTRHQPRSKNVCLRGRKLKYWNHSFGPWEQTFCSQVCTGKQRNKEPL